jgi:hypothetical protein
LKESTVDEIYPAVAGPAAQPEQTSGRSPDNFFLRILEGQ